MPISQSSGPSAGFDIHNPIYSTIIDPSTGNPINYTDPIPIFLPVSTFTGSANAAGQYIDINSANYLGFDISGYNSVIVTFNGTYTGQGVNFQQTSDPTGNSNWVAVLGRNVNNTGSVAPVTGGATASAANQSYFIPVRGVRMRLQLYALSTGTINATISLLTTPGDVGAVYRGGYASDFPSGATAVQATSGVVANASAVASMPAVSGRTNFITGLSVTGSGATTATIVGAALTGPATGMTWMYGVVAGASVKNPDLILSFTPPIPAGAANSALTLTVPALGSGNLYATANIWGYQL